MRTSSIYDPSFVHCSSELKRILNCGYIIPGGCCVDVPCGIGRNSFFLASRYKQVLAVDINEGYLKTLEDNQDTYRGLHGIITTKQMDLDTNIPEQISEADLVVTIHYFSHAFVRKVIHLLKPGAFFYLETPSCSGGNYLELPTVRDLEALLREVKVQSLKTNLCQSPGRELKSASVKCLITKPNA